MAWINWLLDLWDPFLGLLQDQPSDSRIQNTGSSLKLSLRTNPKRQGQYSGNFLDLFKGHGVDLQNIREYQPGDEIRKIDWNVFARTGTPHIKEHFDEKQLPVWFFLDATASMAFGQVEPKQNYASRLIEILGAMALKSGHRIGLMVWQGHENLQITPPCTHIEQLRWVFKQTNASLDLNPNQQACFFPDLTKILRNRCLLFLLSDFMFLESLPHALAILSQLNRKHDLYQILVTDLIEEELFEGNGYLPLTHQEKDLLWFDSQNKRLLRVYRKAFNRVLQEKQKKLSQWGHFFKACSSISPDETILAMVKSL